MRTRGARNAAWTRMRGGEKRRCAGEGARGAGHASSGKAAKASNGAQLQRVKVPKVREISFLSHAPRRGGSNAVSNFVSLGSAKTKPEVPENAHVARCYVLTREARVAHAASSSRDPEG